MLPSTRGGRVDLILSLGVLALGIFATAIAFQLPEAGGYARIGPNFMPKVVSAGLILMGVWLLVVARGFGSVRWLRDLAIGLVLGVAVYLFFVRFLNVNLPAGWLRPLLGTAGI
jgi:hypothetical protein